MLAAEKRISHDNGKVTGTGNLLGCQVIQAKGKTWDKLADLRPGDVCVWDSNLAIYAGGGKWYDAGGPFRSNTKDGRYTNVGPVAPYYDRTRAGLLSGEGEGINRTKQSAWGPAPGAFVV